MDFHDRFNDGWPLGLSSVAYWKYLPKMILHTFCWLICIIHPLSFEIIWPSQWFCWKAWFIAFQKLMSSIAHWNYLPTRIRHVCCWLISMAHPWPFEIIWPSEWFYWKAWSVTFRRLMNCILYTSSKYLFIKFICLAIKQYTIHFWEEWFSFYWGICLRCR